MRRRMKRSTKQYITVALICIIIIGGAATATSIVITDQVKDKYQQLLQTAHQEMEDNKRSVFVSAVDISAGEIIKVEKLEKRTVYSSQPQKSYITKGDIGKTALVDIPKETQIQNTMVTENNVTSNIREIEYLVINMNSNILMNDTVDVRIFYPNGESYVILSKKKIMGYTPETASVFLWIDEAELLRMSAAIVDAALYTGSKLYVTKYIEPNFQEASVVTYTPSLSILSLIESDPNIIERCSQKLNKDIRKALEKRLADTMASDIAAINWDIDPYTTFHADNVQDASSSKVNTSDTTSSEAGTSETNTLDAASSEVDTTETNTSDTTSSEADASNTVSSEVDASKVDRKDLAADEGIDYQMPRAASIPEEIKGDTESDDKELGKEDYFYFAEENTNKGKILN